MNCYKCNKQATPLSNFYAMWMNEGKGLKHVILCGDCIENTNEEDRVCCSGLVMRNVIKKEIYPYLHKEFHECNVPKYYHLFDEWYRNLTATQVAYQQAYSQGRKTILNMYNN